MSSHLYYENLPDIERMQRFRKNIYYKLLDFVIYLNTAKYARKNKQIKINFRIMDQDTISQMFRELNFKYYEIYGYEMNFGEEDIIPIENTIPSEGIFVQLYDESQKIDEHVFEDFLKAQSVVDHPTDRYHPDEQLRVINKYPLFNVLHLEQSPNPEASHLFLSPNIYLIDTKLNSIYNLQCKPRRSHRPLLRLFEAKQNSRWPTVPNDIDVDDWYFLDDSSFPGTQVQRNFVKKALNTPDFAFLEGPPGSGKTRTICELVVQALLKGQRILLCASTHVAVDNVFEKLMDRDDVIAVRIGRKKNRKISPKVKKFLLSERKRTERQRLIQKLSDLGKLRNAGQDYYLNVLTHDTDEVEIQRLILDNANLIGGTMLGILQHPEIADQRESPNAVFDMLIIDEASKTTFQEFIVPALFCRKWILVGDPKQLSPFVDDMEVRKSIEGFLPNNHQIICRDCFCCWKYPEFNLIVSEPKEAILEHYQKQLDALGVEYLDLNETSKISSSDLLGNQVILGTPDQIREIRNRIPPDVFLRGKGFTVKNHASYNYWYKNIADPFLLEQTKGNFGKQYAWRIIREFGLRYSDDDLIRQEYQQDIEKLKPTWYPTHTELRDFNRKISNMKKVAFPSIIELLKEGFYEERNKEQWKHSVIKNGFDEADFQQRYEILQYNHRMHSEISEFPRVHIYDNRALQNNPSIDQLRTWIYPNYSRRSLWISVLQRNVNRTNLNYPEAKVLLKELHYFLEWTQFHPNYNHEHEFWEVSVLTFYSNQKDLLIDLITRKYNRPKSNEFYLRKYNVKIKINTVDGFQGHEADIVFLSFVKTTSIGFLNSINRLNVGITRARYQLVMIGNKHFFLNQDKSPILRKLAQIQGNIQIN